MTPLTLAVGGALRGALGLAHMGGLSRRKPRREAHATYATSGPGSPRNEEALMRYGEVCRVDIGARRPRCAQGCRAGLWPRANQISRQVATWEPWTCSRGAAAAVRDRGGLR
jgi:hypothetical protein